MEKTLEVVDIKVFNRKHRITSLMLGRVNEIIKETQKAWVKFFGENKGFFTSLETKIDTIDTPVEGKGKGIMGTSPSIFKNITIVEIKPPIDINVHTNIEKLVNTESEKFNDVHDTNVEDNSPPDTNVQDEVIVPTEELTVTQTAPSGEATGASEEAIKDKTSEKTKGEFDRDIVVSPSLFSIDTS